MPAAGRHRGGGAHPEPGGSRTGALAALPPLALGPLSTPPGSLRARPELVSPAYYSPVTHGGFGEVGGGVAVRPQVSADSRLTTRGAQPTIPRMIN